MSIAKSKQVLNYHPVKAYQREERGCCALCRHRQHVRVYRPSGQYKGCEYRCAPIVSGGDQNKREFRIDQDHRCDAFERK